MTISCIRTAEGSASLLSYLDLTIDSTNMIIPTQIIVFPVYRQHHGFCMIFFSLQVTGLHRITGSGSMHLRRMTLRLIIK
jgi:hypothetical protein